MILYKHPNNRDIAFEKLSIIKSIDKNYYITKLRYWLRLPESKSYEPMGITDILVLPVSKVNEWVKV